MKINLVRIHLSCGKILEKKSFVNVTVHLSERLKQSNPTNIKLI